MEIIKNFKAGYIAGETAKIEIIAAADIVAAEVVYGTLKTNLTKDNDKFVGKIATDKLLGNFNYTIFATDENGDKFVIANGSFVVRCAGRSPLRDVVDKIDEAIKTWGTNPNRSIAVGEIDITYKNLDDLLAVRGQYVAMAEEQEKGRALTGGLRMVEVKF